jgi:hypothetical protein
MTTNEWIVAYYLTMGWPPEPALLKDASLDGFKREHKAAADQLWSLKKLRGADTDATLKQQIADIADTLKTANDLAQAATDAMGIEKARAMLTGIEAKAQKAKETAKGLEAGFAKDLESMPKYLAALEAARKERDTIAGLPGASDQLALMEELLAKAQKQVSKEGNLGRGYEAGLKELNNHGDILAQARAESQQYLKKEIPREVKDAWAKAQASLDDHGKIAPEFQTTLYKQQLADALASGRQDKDKALKEIRNITAMVDGEVQAQTKLRVTVQGDLKAVAKTLEKLDKDGVPEAHLAVVQDKKKQAEALMGDDEREYQRAAELVEECEAICKSVSKLYEAGGKDWASKAKKLEEIKAKCAQWKRWTPLTASAQSLLEAAAGLEAQVAESHDYASASEQLTNLEKRAADLDARAKESGMPKDTKDVKRFEDDCKKAKDEVDKVYAEVDASLAKLAEKLEGVKNPRNTDYHARLGKCYDAWIGFAGMPTGETVRLLDKQKKTTIDELRELQNEVKALLKKPDELQKVSEAAKASEEKQADLERPQRIQTLLADLKKYKVDASAEQAEANKISSEQLDPGWGRVRKLEDDLTAKLSAAKQKQEEKQRKAGEQLKQTKKALDGFESKDRGFKPYIQQLKAQADDVQALVDSGDPYLYELAVKESNALVTRMEAIDPQRRAKDAKTFAEVEKKWTEMSNELGKGDLVKKRLPDTYADLYDKLQTAIGSARESDPETGLKLLDPLTKSIRDARAKAEKEDFTYKAFKDYKKVVEARWKEITKLTNTSVTDRTKSYEAKFNTRLADATTMAHQEGKINEAIQKLADIKDDLEKIASASNPRQALQEQDVEADREQQLVADMARQFEAALEVYQKTTLPNLRKALKGVKGADADQLDSLEKAPKQAARVVEPYLNILSKLPHKSLAANPAPPLDKAKEDFSTAHKMLNDATRSANWLAENPEGTNVKFTGDLERVAQEWIKSTNGYATGVKTLAKAINEAGQPEADANLKQKSEQVATLLLGEAPKFFGSQAFAKPLGVLLKKDGANDAQTRNANLAAREKALRTVRKYKRQLLTDPLLVKINARENPFEPLTRNAGMVRATLKRLELELLGAL